MPIDVRIPDLDPRDLLDAAEFLAQQLREAPRGDQLNLSRGSVLYDLLIEPAAALRLLEQAERGRLERHWSIADLDEDPAGAPEGVLDRLLSNFATTRDEGTEAAGVVEMRFSEPRGFTLSENTRLISGQQRFLPTNDFIVLPPGEEAEQANERVMVADGSDYRIRINVVAEEPGRTGNLRAQTTLQPSPRPPFFLSARAHDDFTGGTDPESDEDILERIRDGVTAGVISSPSTAAAAVRKVAPGTLAVSVIGAGSPEMQRDRQSLLGASLGGKVDLYARTSGPAVIWTVQAKAEPNGSDQYTVKLDREDVAGAYEVVEVRRAEDQLQIAHHSVTWGGSPQVNSSREAAFSAHQTLELKADHVSAKDGEKMDVEVTLRGQSLIGAIQDRLSDPDHRDSGSDWLARSVTPALTSISLEVEAEPGVEVDAGAVAERVRDAINDRGVTDRLPVSVIYAAAQAGLPRGATVSRVTELAARVINHDREESWARDVRGLKVPEDVERGVSGRTVCYLADEVDVLVKQGS